MSRLIRCDKCGNESTNGIEMFTVQISRCIGITKLESGYSAVFDICADCYKELKAEYIPESGKEIAK